MTREPRTHVSPDEPLATPYLFGVNVSALAPGRAAVLDDTAFGWPANRLSNVPSGDYLVQAVLNRYETFHLSDGRVLKLPPDKGEGQQWASKPGNLYSTPLRLHIDQAHPARTALLLDQEVPAITPKTDTEFVKHVRIRSELLSRFWGRDVFIGAHVLLPKDFAAHPKARFPLMVFHGHYPDDISEFRTTPPDPNLKPVYSNRFHLAAYNIIEQQEAYASYQRWVSADFPRFLVVEIEHANPYYDDSYAVNSANLGPYGDAINQELISEIERRFHGIGAGWARFTYGGSTGGWEALATQVFYPDMYNGAFAACPDPIDFRAYTIINLYQDKNAYALKGEASSVERPAIRNYLGEVFATQRDANYMELAQGDHSRSGRSIRYLAGGIRARRERRPIPSRSSISASGDIDPKVAAITGAVTITICSATIIARDWAKLVSQASGERCTSTWGTRRHLLFDRLSVFRARAAQSTCSPPMPASSLTAIAPSIAGTAIRNSPTPILACATTINICRPFWNASRQLLRAAPTSRVGATNAANQFPNEPANVTLTACARSSAG